jgi:ribosome maturation factor RimP
MDGSGLGKGSTAGKATGAGRPANRGNAVLRGGRSAGPGARAPRVVRPPAAAAADVALSSGPRLGFREAIERTVGGLGYEVVDIERALRGLLRITIDRVPGHAYPTGESEFVLVEDCEAVTRQLQYALEVDGVDYARLEVSSPGLDRPLKRESDYERFLGEQVSVTLKLPFQGRKVFKGVLGRGDPAAAETTEQGAGWNLVFHDGKNEQVLAFTLDEVREARLVPVVNFKGRQGTKTGETPALASPADDGGQGR